MWEVNFAHSFKTFARSNKNTQKLNSTKWEFLVMFYKFSCENINSALVRLKSRSFCITSENWLISTVGEFVFLEKNLNGQWIKKMFSQPGHSVYQNPNTIGERKELHGDTNESTFCLAPTLFTTSGKVWNKRLNFPVCAEFRVPTPIEFS